MIKRFLQKIASQFAAGGNSARREQLKAEAERLRLLGNEQYENGQVEASLQSSQRALTIYQQIKDRQGESKAMLSLGSSHRSLSDYTLAIDYFQQSLVLARQIGEIDVEARALTNLGTSYISKGDYTQAINYFKQSLVITREAKNREVEGKTLCNLGIAYYYLQDYGKAIEYQEMYLIIARTLQDKLAEGAALNNLGMIYNTLGNYFKAIDYLEHSLSIKQPLQSRWHERATLANLSTAYIKIGNNEQGIKYLEQYLAITQEFKDSWGEAIALRNLGANYSKFKDDNRAVEYFQRSLDISQNIQDRLGQAQCLISIANTYRLLNKDHNEVIYYLYQALAIAREIGSRLVEGQALEQLALTIGSSGNYEEAEILLQNVVHIWETIRLELSRDADKVSIFDTQVIAYQMLQVVLIMQDKTNAALEIAERSRTRAFIELLNKRLSLPSFYQATLTQPTIKQIQRISSEQNATLIEYSGFLEQNFFCIWVIKPMGEIVFHPVDTQLLDQQNILLSDLILQARESLGVEDNLRLCDSSSATLEDLRPIRNISSLLRQLHKLLIEPISHLLPTDPNASVIFIPQGDLFLVPFGALQDTEGKFLIEHHTIVTAPSIQVLELTRKQRQRVRALQLSPKNQDVLVVGNPTMPTIPLQEPPQQLDSLPGAEAEARAIASLLQTQAIIGHEATKEHIVQLLPQARLIHLATHGLLDDIRQLGVPGAIALAPSEGDNGFLTAGEILEMKLQAELVVVSACSSGQGKITGDGVIGLSRSLFVAGVPTVIVSLWSVGDDSTEFLMTQFYQNLLQHPSNKAQALRQAMLTTMQEYPNPFSWAAFTLIGEAE